MVHYTLKFRAVRWHAGKLQNRMRVSISVEVFGEPRPHN